MSLTLFFWILVVFYSLYLLVELGLDVLNLKHIDKHKNQIPVLFRESISNEDYQKSIAYTKSKTYFHMCHLLYQTALLWLCATLSVFFIVDQWLVNLIKLPFLAGVLYPFAIGALFYLLNLPFSIYGQFVLEEKFGFNKMSAALFMSDQVKTIIISLVLGLPLIALLLWIINLAGENWWIWGFLSFMVFQLLTTALFPVLIVPIFYKFSPLPEGELKEKLTNLASRLNFKMAGVFTIDGSKRSTHSNAFFAGFGKARRIVLFDTLVKNLTTAEITSVIAHEIGHNIKKHIQQSFILSSIVMLFGFWMLSLCLKWPQFYETFHIATLSMHIGLVLFVLFASVFTFPLSPLFNAISRKNEYEADAFSIRSLNDKENMVSSLIKLSKDNLSNLTPHPWYSFFHYTHPTTLERAKAIEHLKS